MAASAQRKAKTETNLCGESSEGSRSKRTTTPLGGFIFLCSNVNMSQQLRRQLFGLPLEYLERVKAIKPGLPLFLYNFSTGRVYGVFEAACSGGLASKHMEPNQQSFECQYPAQVRVHVRERRPSVDIEEVKSVLYTYDHPEFQLELSLTEAEKLLRLFGCRNSRSRGCHLAAGLSEPDCFSESNVSRNCNESLYGGANLDRNQIGDISGNGCSVRNPKGNVASNMCLQTYRAALKSGISAHSESPKENTCSNGMIERRSKASATLWRRKAVSNGCLDNSFSVTDTGNVQSAKVGKHVDSSRLYNENNQEHISLRKSNNECAFQRLVIENEKLNEDWVGMKDSFDSRSKESQSCCEALEKKITDQGVSGFQSSNPTVNSGSSSQSCQNFNGYSDTTKRGTKTPKAYGNQRYMYVVSNNPPDQAFLSKNNFKCGRSMQMPHWQNDSKEQFNKKQQEQQEQQKQETQQEIPQGHSLSSLSPAFYPAVPLVPWGFQSQFLFSHVPIFDGSAYFPYMLHLFGDRGVQDTHKQNIWMPSLLKESIYAPSGTDIFLSSSYSSLEVNDVNVHALHSEILEFAHNVRPSPEAYFQAQAAVKCVRQLVKNCWPDKDVEVFGSFATGLCLSHSDIDVVVVDKFCQTSVETTIPERRLISLIRVLADQLKECSWCERLTVVESASMPVIRLTCKPDIAISEKGVSPSEAVAIDITIQGKNGSIRNKDDDQSYAKFGTEKSIHSGVSAREFVLDKLHQFPPLAPLVLLLKSYLHHKQLNNVYFGGLGSYSLTLMVVFYLEQVFTSALNVPVTPIASKLFESLCSLNEDSSDEEDMIKRAKFTVNQLLSLLETAGSPNLGMLLIGFLQYFGLCIDFTHMRIVLQGKDGNPGGVFWQSERQCITPLWIEDPLKPGVNVGAGSFAMCHVQDAFLEMLKILMIPLSDLSDTSGQISSQRSSFSFLDQLFSISRR